MMLRKMSMQTVNEIIIVKMMSLIKVLMTLSLAIAALTVETRV